MPAPQGLPVRRALPQTASVNSERSPVPFRLRWALRSIYREKAALGARGARGPPASLPKGGPSWEKASKVTFLQRALKPQPCICFSSNKRDRIRRPRGRDARWS